MTLLSLSRVTTINVFGFQMLIIHFYTRQYIHTHGHAHTYMHTFHIMQVFVYKKEVVNHDIFIQKRCLCFTMMFAFQLCHKSLKYPITWTLLKSAVTQTKRIVYSVTLINANPSLWCTYLSPGSLLYQYLDIKQIGKLSDFRFSGCLIGCSYCISGIGPETYRSEEY